MVDLLLLLAILDCRVEKDHQNISRAVCSVRQEYFIFCSFWLQGYFYSFRKADMENKTLNAKQILSLFLIPQSFRRIQAFCCDLHLLIWETLHANLSCGTGLLWQFATHGAWFVRASGGMILLCLTSVVVILALGTLEVASVGTVVH